MSGLFAAGLILLAAAAAADLAGWRSGPPYVLGAAGSACLAVAGGFALAGRTVRLPVAGWLGQPLPVQPSAALSADRLSGLFLVMAFGAAALVSVAFASWAPRPDTPTRRGLGADYALALGAVAVIVTARDAFTALFGWEALTIAFYLLAGSSRRRSQAAQVTFAFGKLSGAALLAGLLLLAAKSHSISLASFTHVPGGAARTTAVVLLLAGFAVKAGLVPLQVWLPPGYAAAPGPARAIMAGVCVNVAFYGMWRTLALLGRPPGWLVGALLVLGAVTALLGIAHATVQNRLNRVIAYSSVENTGLIVVGFGVALTGAAVHDQRLIAAGLLAATLQMVAHTAAKSLLFTSAAGLEDAAGHDDLEQLRGAARSAPWSGFGLAIGSLTLAGLPLTAGFVSEWFLLEIPSMLLVVVAFTWVASGRRMLRVRRVPAWRSATMGVEGADSYTAFGYANPARRVLTSILHTQAELRPVVPDDGEDAADAPPQPHLEYTSDVIEVVETYLYRPGRGLFGAVVTAAKRLQSGRLDAYLLYMLIALIAVIAVVTAMA